MYCLYLSSDDEDVDGLVLEDEDDSEEDDDDDDDAEELEEGMNFGEEVFDKIFVPDNDNSELHVLIATQVFFLVVSCVWFIIKTWNAFFPVFCK